MQVFTDSRQIPDTAPPSITIHVLPENKRPIGFAPWPKESKKKRKKKREHAS